MYINRKILAALICCGITVSLYGMEGKPKPAHTVFADVGQEGAEPEDVSAVHGGLDATIDDENAASAHKGKEAQSTTNLDAIDEDEVSQDEGTSETPDRIEYTSKRVEAIIDSLKREVLSRREGGGSSPELYKKVIPRIIGDIAIDGNLTLEEQIELVKTINQDLLQEEIGDFLEDDGSEYYQQHKDDSLESIFDYVKQMGTAEQGGIAEAKKYAAMNKKLKELGCVNGNFRSYYSFFDPQHHYHNLEKGFDHALQTIAANEMVSAYQAAKNYILLPIAHIIWYHINPEARKQHQKEQQTKLITDHLEETQELMSAGSAIIRFGQASGKQDPQNKLFQSDLELKFKRRNHELEELVRERYDIPKQEYENVENLITKIPAAENN